MTLILPVNHIKQQSNWDCGITCLRMLIDYYHLDISTFTHLLDSYECNRSTWTIDLLHLLHQSGIHAILHTITVGCSTSYENVPYYENLIHKDRERIDKLFISEASNIKLGSLEWTDLKKHLIEEQVPCLVLVDAEKLDCHACSKSIVIRFFNKLISKVSSTYQGHYILVTGYIIKDNEEFIRYVDPGKTDGFCTTTIENFEIARKAFGTDEDLILCYKNHNK